MTVTRRTNSRPSVAVLLLCCFLFAGIVPGPGPARLSAAPLLFKEQIYKLYHYQLYMTPLDIAENIGWLEMALEAEFANPLWALTEIKTAQEYTKYRALFMMHLNLKMIEMYLLWGSKYNKREAYFFNFAFRRQNLESLEIAEDLFRRARYYWDQAQIYSAQAAQTRWIFLDAIQNWEDESYRIQTGELDYNKIIDKHLDKLAEVRAAFEEMDTMAEQVRANQ